MFGRLEATFDKLVIRMSLIKKYRNNGIPSVHWTESQQVQLLMTEAKYLHTAVDTVVRFLDKVSSLINKNLTERRTIEKC